MSDEEKRRNEILTKLVTIREDMIGVYQQWIDQVIEYIKEQR
jgi:hypothetical protein